MSDEHDDTATKKVDAVSEMRNGRWNTVGMPTEKSKDFRGSTSRLLDRMGPEKPKLYGVLALVDFAHNEAGLAGLLEVCRASRTSATLPWAR